MIAVSAALLAEAFLRGIGEFRIESALLTAGLIFYSVYTKGMPVPQILLFLLMLPGLPAVTAGCAVGTGLWIRGMLFGAGAPGGFFSHSAIGIAVIPMLIGICAFGVNLRSGYREELDQEQDPKPEEGGGNADESLDER